MRFVIILVVLLAVVVGIWACAMQPEGPEAEPETARAGARETGGPAAGTREARPAARACQGPGPEAGGRATGSRACEEGRPRALLHVLIGGRANRGGGASVGRIPQVGGREVARRP